jgi:malonyl CoA-acyl carrier protein transacylase
MLDAAEAFAEFLAPMSFSAPKVTVVSNVTAQPYPLDDASDSIKSLLVKQITHSVRWTQTIRYLLAQGVDRFEELGPGNVLTSLTAQIRGCAWGQAS